MILKDLSQLSQLRDANVQEDLADKYNVVIDLQDLAESNTKRDWDFSDADKNMIHQVKQLSQLLEKYGIFGEFNWFLRVYQISKEAPSGYPLYLTIEINEDSYSIGMYDYDFAEDLLDDVLNWRNN